MQAGNVQPMVDRGRMRKPCRVPELLMLLSELLYTTGPWETGTS